MKKTKWDRFLENLGEHLFLSQIIRTWYERAQSAEDRFDKFIYLWIAFDAFATNYSEKEWPKQVRKNIEKDSLLTNCYVSSMKNNDFSREIRELQKLCPVYDTRKKFLNDPKYSVTISDPNNFKEVINVLYKIRNNLFHGGKSPNEERDKKLVSLAFNILSKISTLIFFKASII